MRLIYFAAVREAIGRDSDDIIMPNNIVNIVQCLDYLIEQDAVYAAAFANPDQLRFALDQTMAKMDAPLAGATELAIFPPVTGG